MSNLNNTALIIIDVQKGLFEKATPVYNADSFIDNICMLIDRIIPKHHSSAFEGTTLAEELETREID
jgi:nicotinamidase-related amidase